MKKKTRKVTISLSALVSEWADELSEAKGYDNFSAYVADLIRSDKERYDERQLRKLTQSSGSLPKDSSPKKAA